MSTNLNSQKSSICVDERSENTKIKFHHKSKRPKRELNFAMDKEVEIRNEGLNLIRFSGA